MAPQIISPFDPVARERLWRLGLLTSEDRVNTVALEAICAVHAALLFSQIYDACGDWARTLSVCRRITSQAPLVSDRQVLLLISIQYDTIAKPLPEVIWWISGSEILLAPFVRGFVRKLDEFCEDIREGGDVM